MNRQKKVFLSASIFLAIAMVIPCLYTSPVVAGPTTSLPAVVVITPDRGDITQVLRLSGNLEPFEMVTLYPNISGYVDYIPKDMDIGSKVNKGDVLARLFIPEMAAEIKLREAEVRTACAMQAKADADLKLANITATRLSNLHKKEPGAVTRQEVEMAEAEKAIASALVGSAGEKIKVAQAKLDLLKALEGYTEIKAPFAGIVTKRHIHHGALLTKGTGNPTFDVARTDKFRLKIDIPEVLVPYVNEKSKVKVLFDALPGRVFEKTVARRSDVLSRKTRRMRVEVDFDATDGAFSGGMYATVFIDLKTIPGALTVPATALRVSAKGVSYVFTVRDNTVRMQPVTIVMDDGKKVVIAGGLQSNPLIVVAGPSFLEDGQKVEIHHAKR